MTSTPLAFSSHPNYTNTQLKPRRTVSFTHSDNVERMPSFSRKRDERASPSVISPPPSSPEPSGTRVVDGPDRMAALENHDHVNSNTSTPSVRSRKNPQGSRSALNWNPQLTLENSGSVARDHLASERTFLAYVRTSLAIASTGVALVQLFTISVQSSGGSGSSGNGNGLTTTVFAKRIQVYAKPLGSAAVCFGILVLGIGTLRYFRIQSALTKGKFPVARVTIAGMAFILGVIVVVVFVILVSGKR
ncbi:hypothetical protein D9758_014507 [Tetrapyrgos nigripes]|uniref:DUF202 domain-containing protein n=1 Tax=Tetrapyrgos nigripes TaxID=182062 RepID=A0A8H5CTE7_9AGAR|nr:hypothetical protein D9758_014507 [Tetrapyrgos nigripes]